MVVTPSNDDGVLHANNSPSSKEVGTVGKQFAGVLFEQVVKGNFHANLRKLVIYATTKRNKILIFPIIKHVKLLENTFQRNKH